MSPAIDFRKSRFSHSERFFPDIKVIVPTPGVYSSKPELATSDVIHNKSLMKQIFLGGLITDEAWSLPVQTYLGYGLACTSSQHDLWPLKVELYSLRHDLTMGLNNC
jgi:hypothetical protein